MKDLENYIDPNVKHAVEIVLRIFKEDKITFQEAFDLITVLNKKDDKETLTYPVSPLPYPYPQPSPYEPCKPYTDPNPNPWAPYPIITWYHGYPGPNTNDSSRNDLHTYTTNTTC